MRPRTNISADCGTRTGAGPLVIEPIGTTRIAEHVASHRETTLLSPSASRRAGAPWLTTSHVGAQRRLVGEPPRGDPIGDHMAQLLRSEDSGIRHVRDLVRVRVDVPTDGAEFGCAACDR